MKYLIYTLLLILRLSPAAAMMMDKARIEEDAGKNLYPAIQKVSNTFYTSKIPHKNLTLVMERIDGRTLPLWLNYISVQSNERVTMLASSDIKGTTGDGSLHFKKVLEEALFEANEVWVAYVSRSDNPQPIPDSMEKYSVKTIDNLVPFAKDIEMFLTVTSSPQALITSHVGIASTYEGFLQGRTKGTSLDLHSFAAKVMLMRNPKRRCMVNAPGFAMGKMMLDTLPHATFFGTREMLQVMKERQKVSFEEFKKDNETLTIKILKEMAAKQAVRFNMRLKSSLSQLHEGKLENETEESLHQEAVESIPPQAVIELQGGNFVISESKVAARLPNKLQEAYNDFKNPYRLPGEVNAESFLALMEKHPPLLSVDEVTAIKNSFALFGSEKSAEPWLSVVDGNTNYQWMFTGTFRPTGSTYYLVVDLRALAESRPVA